MRDPPNHPAENAAASEKNARFAACVSRHHGAIYRLCRFYEFDAEARRDLEQEILIALWKAFDLFRGEASERTYVLRVAHNVAASHAESSMRRKRLDDDHQKIARLDEAHSPDGAVEARSTLERIETHLRTLDVTSRQMMLLYLEGLSAAEIADVTGLSATNITTKIARLRHDLTLLDQRTEASS
jgi:RNA polymerase sigma-70 factor (ECF subfamily)